MVNLTKRKFSHDYLHKINRFIGVEDYLTVQSTEDSGGFSVQWRVFMMLVGGY